MTRNNSGFNLVEAAIVLGVIGLVIGGIWTAAAKLSFEHKWTQTQNGWFYYLDILDKHFNAKAIAGSTTIDLYNFLNALPYPDGWTRGGNYGIHPLDPYGHSLTMQTQAHLDRFYIGVSEDYPAPDGLRHDVCIRLERMFMTRIYARYQRLSGGPNAACATDINQCCTHGGSDAIGAYFKLPN